MLKIHRQIAQITQNCLKDDHSFFKKHLNKKIILINESQISAGDLSIKYKKGPKNQNNVITL